jgi:peptidyl-prolyl cis-trans isomerase C
MFVQALLFSLVILVASQIGLGGAAAQDAVVAMVNGRPITESDMRFAEVDLGGDLEAIAPENRRRVLLEYLIENQLLSEAAEQARIDREPEAEAQLRYVRRRVLRDRFYDSRFAASVTEEEARDLYNREIASTKPEEEIHARHILVLTEQEAREQRARIVAGTSFATVAQEVSQDPGNAADGGDLGYFTRGQFDASFEEAIVNLERGVLSEPIQTRFGWHLVLVEDKRARPIPSFEELKASIISLLIQRKALEQVSDLRGKAKIDIRDAEVGGQPAAANPSPR